MSDDLTKQTATLARVLMMLEAHRDGAGMATQLTQYEAGVLLFFIEKLNESAGIWQALAWAGELPKTEDVNE